MKIDADYIKKIKEWGQDPLLWVEDIFSDAIARKELRITTQQKQAFIAFGEIVRAKLKMDEGKELSDKERVLAKKFGLSIQSGNGTGKDCFAAIVILFFLFCYPHPKIVATANSAKQLRNVLWSEIKKWMNLSNKIDSEDPASKTILESLFEYQTEKIYEKGDGGATWFAEAVTINTKATDTEQAEGIAGRHARFMLIVVDEASGIAESVFNKFEATMTSPMNLMLIIFNPTRGKGYAIESQNSPHWVALRWNAEDSEIVPKEHVERIEEKYSKDSNPYRIRVLGLPPSSDTDSLIPYDWIMDSVDREIDNKNEPSLMGVDVGAGGDKSVLLIRKGGKVESITRYNEEDTMKLVGHTAQKINSANVDATLIDIIGIGKGVYDRLRETGHRVFSVDVRRSARLDFRFQRLRDELWWKVREEFEKGTISIPNDKEIIDQLSSIKYEIDPSGRVKIESKKQMKSRGQHSPDESDALCLTFSVNDAIFRAKTKPIDGWDEEEVPQAASWMSA